MTGLVTIYALSLGVFVFGWWGRQRAEDWAPRSLSATGRAASARSLRRGALSVQVIGVMLAVLATLDVVNRI